MAQHSRDNHFVPQFYLKRWSTNGNTVWDYRTIIHHPNEPIWKRSSIKNSACWKDLYTQHGQEAIDTKIEDFFSDCIETPSLTAFQKIDNGESPSSRDIDVLVNLLIAQLFRTPYAMVKEAQIIRKSFAKVAQKTAKTVSLELNSGRITPNTMNRGDCSENQPFPTTPLSFKMDSFNNEIHASTTLGRQQFLSAFGNLYYGAVGKTLRSYLWRIIQMPIGVELPTSDNPVVVFGINPLNGHMVFDVGIGTPKAIIVFPLDTRHMLFTQVGVTACQLLQFEPDTHHLDFFIRAIIQNAGLHIFAKKQLRSIQNIRPREINPEKATELLKVRQQWDEIQNKVDENLN